MLGRVVAGAAATVTLAGDQVIDSAMTIEYTSCGASSGSISPPSWASRSRPILRATSSAAAVNRSPVGIRSRRAHVGEQHDLGPFEVGVVEPHRVTGQVAGVERGRGRRSGPGARGTPRRTGRPSRRTTRRSAPCSRGRRRRSGRPGPGDAVARELLVGRVQQPPPRRLPVAPHDPDNNRFGLSRRGMRPTVATVTNRFVGEATRAPGDRLGSERPGRRAGRLDVRRAATGARDVVVRVTHCGDLRERPVGAALRRPGRRSRRSPGTRWSARSPPVGRGRRPPSVTGDPVAVGNIVGSCGVCPECRAAGERLPGVPDVDLRRRRSGVRRDHARRVVDGVRRERALPLCRSRPASTRSAVAPLLCAGVTTYAPLRRFGAWPGDHRRAGPASAASATWRSSRRTPSAPRRSRSPPPRAKGARPPAASAPTTPSSTRDEEADGRPGSARCDIVLDTTGGVRSTPPRTWNALAVDGTLGPRRHPPEGAAPRPDEPHRRREAGRRHRAAPAGPSPATCSRFCCHPRDRRRRRGRASRSASTPPWNASAAATCASGSRST